MRQVLLKAQRHALNGQLCECGVLIVGSGQHRPRGAQRAVKFDIVVHDQIKQGELDALQHFQRLGQVAQQAHPSHEHYLPLLYAAAAAEAREMPRFFNTGYQSASISMRSVLWG